MIALCDIGQIGMEDRSGSAPSPALAIADLVNGGVVLPRFREREEYPGHDLNRRSLGQLGPFTIS